MRPPTEERRDYLYREIPSNLEAVDSLCREIRSLLQKKGLSARSFPVEAASREYLNNAVMHGNRRDERKKVTYSLRIGRKWIHVQITDEGAGFDWKSAQRSPLPDPAVTSGRGIFIGALYAEGVAFNRRGNRVTLKIKREIKGGSSRHGELHD